MNGNKVNINKIVEIAAGVIAVLVALGELLSSILSPVMSFANDLTTTSKIFRIIMGLEKSLICLPVIIIGVALILRWVSQLKLKWVTFAASAFAGLMFIIYQFTDYIYSFVLAKSLDYSMSHPVRNLVTVLFYAVVVLVLVFLIYESQNNIIKKNSMSVTLIAAYVGVGFVLFLSMGLYERAAWFIFPLLLIVSVFSRKDAAKEKNLAYYFGIGGIAAALIFSLLNAYINPICIIAKNTDIFTSLLYYNDALITIALGLIPLLFLSREFSSRTDLSK